jgi:hypothetical protein
MQHYVINFVSDLRQVGGFLRVLLFPPPLKLTATLFSSTSRVGTNIGFQAPVRQMMLPHEESIHVECVRYRYYEINWVGGFLRVLLFPPPLKLTATL